MAHLYLYVTIYSFQLGVIMSNVLYSNNSSYYSMIARLVLAEKNVNYELRNIEIHIKTEQFNPEYVKIQPNMTVPTMTSGANILQSSRDIIFFANNNFPGQDLLPEKDKSAIEKSIDIHYSFSIEDFTMGTAVRKSPIAKFALGRGLKKGTKRCLELLKAHPEFKDVCEKKLNLEDERRRLILSADNNYEEMKQKSIELCDMLEQQLSKQEYAASDNYSLADVVWTVFLARLHMTKFDSLITDRPHLYKYWQSMSNRDSYTKANICTKMPTRLMIRIMLSLIFS